MITHNSRNPVATQVSSIADSFEQNRRQPGSKTRKGEEKGQKRAKKTGPRRIAHGGKRTAQREEEQRPEHRA